MSYINYLDWYDLFVNEISGGVAIFLFLSFILIAYMSAQARFPNIVTLAIFIVYALLISPFFPQVLAVTLLILGMFFAWGLSRLISRG